MAGSIQGSINSMIGAAGSAIRTVQALRLAKQAINTQKSTASSATRAKPIQTSPQTRAEVVARQSSANAIQAKQKQKRKFSDYLAKMQISIGNETKKIGDLEPAMQAKIGASYSKSQRRQIMDQMDKEAKNGKR